MRVYEPIHDPRGPCAPSGEQGQRDRAAAGRDTQDVEAAPVGLGQRCHGRGQGFFLRLAEGQGGDSRGVSVQAGQLFPVVLRVFRRERRGIAAVIVRQV